MFVSKLVKFAIVGATALSVAACNTTAVVKQPDGTVQIVDSKPDSVPEIVHLFRDEGKKAAAVCATYGPNSQRVRDELTKLGYKQGKTLFGKPVLRKRPPLFGYATTTSSPDTPCEFGFDSLSGGDFFTGAEVQLYNMGYAPQGSGIWVKGGSKVSLTGQRTTSTYGASSTVKILRQ